MRINLPVVLFLIFLVLKLTGFIAWSWLWVTAPLWIGLALFLVVSLIALAFAGIGVLVTDRAHRRRVEAMRHRRGVRL